jgi:hypothetical protein
MDHVAGLLDNLTQAAHIVAGMPGTTFSDALEIVNAARDAHLAKLREQEYRDAIAESDSNVIQFRPRQK